MKRAFTLLEALITTTVIALLAVSAFPFLNKYQEQMNLANAALSIQTCLNSVQEYAKAPQDGATQYTAALTGNRCAVSVMVNGSSTELDTYDFTGLTVSFPNGSGANALLLSVVARPPYTPSIALNSATLPATLQILLTATSNPAVTASLNLVTATGITSPQ